MVTRETAAQYARDRVLTHMHQLKSGSTQMHRFPSFHLVHPVRVRTRDALNEMRGNGASGSTPDFSLMHVSASTRSRAYCAAVSRVTMNAQSLDS